MFGIPKKFKEVKRFYQIVDIIRKYELGFFLKKIMGRKTPKKELYQPERIRLIMQELGGTFIKLAQLLSLRPDLIPNQYCDELAKLQDEVEPFSGEEAKKIIESELQKPVKELFKEFDEKPIAAASIGQVHKAVLKNGKKVAIKVQRPNIRNIIDTDLDILTYFALLIKNHVRQSIFDPVEIASEFKTYTENEMDYVKEARNIGVFYENFKKTNVKIPKVYWEYTTKRILTMEFIEGMKASELKKVYKKESERKIIAENVANSILKQIFIDGFFHADPHPGNIIILKKNNIAFVDFGIAGVIGREIRDNVTELFISLVRKDLDGIAKSLVKLNFVEETVDMEKLKEDLVNTLGEYHNTSIKYVNIGELFLKCLDTAKRNNIKVHKNFVLLGKALITAEGFAKDIYPNFNLIDVAEPFVQKLIKEKYEPRRIVEKMINTSGSVKDFFFEVPETVHKFLNDMNRENKYLENIDEDILRLKRELDIVNKRHIFSTLFVSFLVLSTALLFIDQIFIFDLPAFSLMGYCISLIMLILLIIYLFKKIR